MTAKLEYWNNQPHREPMEPISPPIRNAVRALILRDNSILLLRKAGS